MRGPARVQTAATTAATCAGRVRSLFDTRRDLVSEVCSSLILRLLVVLSLQLQLLVLTLLGELLHDARKIHRHGDEEVLVGAEGKNRLARGVPDARRTFWRCAVNPRAADCFVHALSG